MWSVFPDLQEPSHLHILMHEYIPSFIQNQNPPPIPSIRPNFQSVDLPMYVSRVNKASPLICVYQDRRCCIAIHVVTEIVVFLKEQLPTVLLGGQQASSGISRALLDSPEV